MKLKHMLVALSVFAVWFGAIVSAHAAPPSDQWDTDFNAALKTARSQSKPLLVMFSASWCPPCNVMKKDVLPKPEVQSALDKWSLAYIDIDENKKLPSEYRVQVIPTFVMIDAAGKELGRFNFMKADNFTSWLEASRKEFVDLNQIDQQLEAKPNDAAFLKKRADILANIALRLSGISQMTMVATPDRLQLAIDAYKKAQAAGDKSPELQANTEFLTGVLKAVKGDFAAAAPQLEAYAKQNPNGPFAPDALFWRAVVAAQLKQGDQSKTLLKEYADKYPNGRYTRILASRD